MKRYLIGFVVSTAMASAALSNVVADSDEDELQGEWLLASIEVQGKTLPATAGKGGSIVFDKDGKVILKDPGKADKIGKYKINAGNEPKQIDLTGLKDGEAMQGIYEFDGDKLKMAFSAQGAKGKRPRDYKGDKVLVTHWKRQKP